MIQRIPDPIAAAERAARFIADADLLIIAAGAGMGVDSGLPDYRGKNGFWQAYPALGRARIEFSRIASPSAMRRDRRLCWGFYGHCLKLYRDVVPHDGFRILQSWANHKPEGAVVFTSNVDGQFQRAGFGADRVQECHGSIHWLQYLQPCSTALWPATDRLPADLAPQIDEQACRWVGELPSCPRCGGLLRPNVLMFNDEGWVPTRSDVQSATIDVAMARATRPVVVEIGAGVHIPTVRHFSRDMQRDRGAPLVRINPREWSIGAADGIAVAAGALEGLRLIDERR